MRPETIELMCNPYKGEPLIQQDNWLVGVTSGQTFEIKNNIPVILTEDGLKGRNKTSKLVHDLTAFAYDAVVTLGDLIQLNSERRVREKVISGLPVKAGNRVLETAVGTASNLTYLPKETQYFGLDISYPMLRRAARKAQAAGRNAALVQADCAFIPYRDETFDCVFQMGGLQFMEDPFKAVSEMARVAKPGAPVYVVDEVGGAVRTLSRLPAHREHARDKDSAVEAVKRLVPFNLVEIESKTIPETDFYLLSFKKPTL
jgi:ubiquinone/menaquinone biosynthesis C-methylase UbiE